MDNKNNKDIIAIVKQMVVDGIITQKDAEKYCPELAESEDERIRKEIVDYVNKEYRHTIGLDERNRWIAWLEKQGEPIDKIVKRATTEKQRVLLTETNDDANIDWDTRSLQDVKLLLEYGLNYIKKLEKQGEQKSAVFIPKFRVGDIVKSKLQSMLRPRKITSIGKDCYWCEDRGCIGFAWEDDYEFVEQNPAWSEEDENKMNNLIQHLKVAYSRCDWLDETINWLKSLKERYTWKPSEEQIKTLEFVIESIDNMLRAIGHIDNVTKPQLKEVLAALKKLREE